MSRWRRGTIAGWTGGCVVAVVAILGLALPALGSSPGAEVVADWEASPAPVESELPVPGTEPICPEGCVDPQD